MSSVVDQAPQAEGRGTGTAGPLDDPFAGWPNDDLLFGEAERRYFARNHKRALPIFDWPELRRRFAGHDPQAATFRRRSRRNGLTAVTCGAAGLVLMALAAVTSDAAEILGGTAAVLTIASGLLGYTGVLSGRTKMRWLHHRFWTERMRQLHFQLIVNNLPLAVAAMSDTDARRRFRTMRAAELERLEHRVMLPFADTLERMKADLADDRPWLNDSWEQAPPGVARCAPDDLKEMFAILRHHRFGIQRRYATLKLAPGAYSPRSRARFVRGASDALTVLILLLAALLGLILFRGAALESSAVKALVAASAIFSAGVIALRAIDEGLQLRSETERYEWYRAAVESLERRYVSADDETKVGILREMEVLSYQELRWFTTAFCNARFIM